MNKNRSGTNKNIEINLFWTMQCCEITINFDNGFSLKNINHEQKFNFLEMTIYKSLIKRCQRLNLRFG